jgi:septum formation inhibitor MinC
MKRLTSFKSRLGARLGLAAVIAALCLAGASLALCADSKSEQDTKQEKKTEKKAEKKAEKPEKAEKKKLSGADLYAMHCNRCHPERYATERSPAQWKTIMLHMRVRANLPAEQARTILKYLQEDAGTP